MVYLFKWRQLSWQDVDRAMARTYVLLQIFSNAVGIGICFLYFVFFDGIQSLRSDLMDNLAGPLFLSVLLMILGYSLSYFWTKEIRRFIRMTIQDLPIPEILEKKAGRKIVNLPLASAVISLVCWTLATIIVPFFIAAGPSRTVIGMEVGSYLWVAVGVGTAGVVTCIMVFFLTELMCRPMWETFFPNGELIRTKGVFRVNLWQRILIIFLMATLFPLTDMAVVSYQKAQMMMTHDPVTVLKSLMLLIVFLLAVEFSLVVVLSIFMSRSIVAPVLNLKSAMSKVAKGDFTAQAKVVDNNELGVLSHHFNRMTKGLKERYQLLETLAVAKEVQQNLLPEAPPRIEGLDIDGRSLYCDQTGGDYYDFIASDIEGKKGIAIAVGDVSGHGIPSALLMASARAFLRQRFALPGSLAKVANDVNLQFCRDVGVSGRFLTLFIAVVNPRKKTFEWVRAGHDPALVYDPQADGFIELKKGGIPLGVDDSFDYRDCVVYDQPFRPGQILFMGTDGIWESRNRSGEMFGKERVQSVIRAHQHLGASGIVDAVYKSLNLFMGDDPFTDDVTLLVIKKKHLL